MDFLKTPSKTNSAHSKHSDTSNVNKGSATFSIDEDDDMSSKNSSHSVKVRFTYLFKFTSFIYSLKGN